MIHDTDTFSQAVVFLDAAGHYVARGLIGARYIFPDTWHVQHAPNLTRVPGRERWLRMWKTLPPLIDWSALDDILETKEKSAYGMRMLSIPYRRAHDPCPQEKLTTETRRDKLLDLIESDARQLQGYLKFLRRQGELEWWNVPGYGFKIIAGSHWLVYHRLKSPRFVTSFGW